MMQIAFAYSSARFRLSVVQGADRVETVLAARKRLRRFVDGDPRLERFDPERWMDSFTLAENLFFGPVKADRRGSWGPFESRIDTLVEETGLRRAVLSAGLERELGEDGVSLNAHQRRRVALARALLKQPCALVLDGIAAGESQQDRQLRMLLAELLAAQPDDAGGPGALIYAASTPEAAAGADHVIWVSPEDGRVTEGDFAAFSQVDWNESRGR